MKYNIAILLVCLTLMPLVGACSRGPSYRCVNLSGTVSIDGKPVPKGYVTLSPLDQNAGPVVGGKIMDGQYRCENVPLGKHHAILICQSTESTTVVERPTGTRHDIPKNILPSRYQPGIDVEVKAGQTTLDFALQSKSDNARQ
jgi:hypothetical protein